MKKIVFILCFTMLLKPIVPVFEYIFNYDYIANELCENKDKPVMGCNGKCYLMKELAKASENEKPISSDKKHTVSETNDLFFTIPNDYPVAAAEFPAPVELNAAYRNLYANLSTDSCFHPPAVIS
ncbi:hypothetical protein [Flavobacterium sp.]|uniref:hypothetical protein n=1 Tax=Flavobacterium sp. TaxID=239 RepID=UPI0039E37007